jgi:hypothetical protein
LRKVYSFDPMPTNLPPQLQSHILGTQGNEEILGSGDEPKGPCGKYGISFNPDYLTQSCLRMRDVETPIL